MRVALGVDIGGGSVKAGLVDEAGNLVGGLVSEPVGDDPLAAVLEAGRAALAKSSDPVVVGIGMGSPGYLDADRTSVVYSVNLGWRDLPIADIVAKEFDLPVVLEGDAFVAALGEALAGAGRGVSDVLTVTLGTGVGVGHVIEGVLMVGAHGLAGQAGHIPIPGIEGECPCGRSGCWELAASTAALERSAREAGFESAQRALSDAQASDLVDRWTSAVASGLVMLAGVLDPGMIVIAGAASASADSFLPTLRERLNDVAPEVELAAATLGGAAGTVGAGLLAWQRYG